MTLFRRYVTGSFLPELNESSEKLRWFASGHVRWMQIRLVNRSMTADISNVKIVENLHILERSPHYHIKHLNIGLNLCFAIFRNVRIFEKKIQRARDQAYFIYDLNKKKVTLKLVRPQLTEVNQCDKPISSNFFVMFLVKFRPSRRYLLRKSA